MKVSLYKMEERIKINQDTVVFGKFYVHIKSVENKQPLVSILYVEGVNKSLWYMESSFVRTSTTPNTILLGLKALLNAMYTNKNWEISLIKFPDDVKQDILFKHITKSMSLDLYEAVSLSVDILSCKDPNFIPYYITPPKSDDEIVCIKKMKDAIRIPCEYRGPNFLYIISILGKSKVLAGVLTPKNRDTKSLIKLKWVPINVRNDSSYYIRHDGIEYNISEHINRYNLKRISF